MLGILRELFTYLPPRRTFRFTVLLAGMVLVAVLETLTAGVISFYAASFANPGLIIQDYIPKAQKVFPWIPSLDTKGLILALSLTVIALVVVKNAAAAVVTYATNLYTANVSGHLGRLMFGGFLDMPYEWHTRHFSADLIQNVGWSQYFGLLLRSVLKFVSDTLIVAILLTTILVANPAISVLVFLTIGGASLAIISHARRAIDRLTERQRAFNISINRQVSMAFHGIKELKVYNRTEGFIDAYADEFLGLARIEARLGFVNQLPGWLLEILGVGLLSSAIMIMFLWFGDSTAKITGTIALLAVTSWRVIPAMGRILNSLNSMRESLPYVQTGLGRLREVHARPRPARTGRPARKRFEEAFRVENVTFGYQGTNTFAVEDLTLTIPRGQVLGIIGTSGAGKSTLADITAGLLPPATGDLLLDGRRLAGEDLAGWQSLIGYVPQTPYILPGTLAENVAFGVRKEEIDMEKVMRCCRMAAMDDFLHELPQGIETYIGERGVKLSGGQRQRVAIARALYNDPEVIIFDEATSALDEKNEQAIQNTINTLKERITLIIIAHRLTTVEGCDRVVWLDKGRVRLVGDAKTVIAQFRRQSGEAPEIEGSRGGDA